MTLPIKWDKTGVLYIDSQYGDEYFVYYTGSSWK